jgi:hypothetical protein
MISGAAAERLMEALEAAATAAALRHVDTQALRHALWWFGDRADGGIQPGGRDEKLLELLSIGDDETIDALVQTHPFANLAIAWVIGREEGGIDRLRATLESRGGAK